MLFFTILRCQGNRWRSWTLCRTPLGLSPSPGGCSPVRPRTFWSSPVPAAGQMCWLCAAPITLCTCTTKRRSAWWVTSRVTRLLCVGCVSLISPLTCCSPALPMGHCGAGTFGSPVLMPPRCSAAIRHIHTARLMWAVVIVCCAQAQSRWGRTVFWYSGMPVWFRMEARCAVCWVFTQSHTVMTSLRWSSTHGRRTGWLLEPQMGLWTCSIWVWVERMMLLSPPVTAIPLQAPSAGQVGRNNTPDRATQTI